MLGTEPESRSCHPELNIGFAPSATLNMFQYYKIRSLGVGWMNNRHEKKKAKGEVLVAL